MGAGGGGLTRVVLAEADESDGRLGRAPRRDGLRQQLVVRVCAGGQVLAAGQVRAVRDVGNGELEVWLR
jgi:hypothetical protein